MSDSQKYYYIKLKENYFEQDNIKVLESMKNGHTYSLIIIKLYLKSAKFEGKLMMTPKIPYDPQKVEILASVIGHDPAHVREAIKVGVELELITIIEGSEIWMTDIQNFIGKSSTEADRKREYRKHLEDKQEAKGQISGQTSGQMSGQNSDKSPPEIRDKSIEIRDKSIKIERTRESDDSPSPKSSKNKAVSKTKKDRKDIALQEGSETILYNRIQKAFLSKNGDRFTDYGKEGKAIKGLVKKAEQRSPEDPASFIYEMIKRLWELKNSQDKFWVSQPFLPSTLNASGLFDRVLETFREQEDCEITEEELDELARMVAR